jgi:hypothetical protein
MQVSRFELISGYESSVGKKLAELSNHARPILMSVVPHKAEEADGRYSSLLSALRTWKKNEPFMRGAVFAPCNFQWCREGSRTPKRPKPGGF